MFTAENLQKLKFISQDLIKMVKKIKKKKKLRKSLDKEIIRDKLLAFLEQQELLKKRKLKKISKKKKIDLEEIIEAIKEIKQEEKPDKTEYRPIQIKTNYDTPAEIYQSKTTYKKETYTRNTKPEKNQNPKYECEIKTQNQEQLSYEDIERITNQDIVNSLLGMEKWNNISPHEREDYENWRKLSPGAKIIWWSLVQNSGYGVRDIDSA